MVHNNSLLHRDVKPTNIMLRSGKSEAVLIDFGIAREFTQNLTQTHTQMLSDGFAPIEQYDKRAKRGAYTDVYALAATLYSLLTGEVPTLAPLRAAGMSLEPPKQINPSISDRVNQAILKGMEVNAGDRPQSMQEWLAFLGMRIYPTTPSFPQVPPVIPVTSPPCYQSPLQSASVQLVSAVGVDYSKLRDLLAAGKWKEADRQTERVMLWVAGRERQGWFRTEDIEQFPCKDFCTIDQLWIKYSKGRFGFSVQKRIWKSVNGGWQKYGNIVGWRVQDIWLKYDSLTFTIDAPFGHLPVSCCKAYISWDWWTLRFLRSGVFGCGGASIRCLASRLVSCNEH